MLTSRNTCYNSSLFVVKKKNDSSCMLHEVQELVNLHNMNCIVSFSIELLYLSKRLVALPNIFFISPEDERVACFTRLSAVRSSANRLQIRSERLCLQGSCARPSEKSSFLYYELQTHKRNTV